MSSSTITSRPAQALETLRSDGGRQVLAILWARAFMSVAHLPVVGRSATRLAGWATPPYYGRFRLARYNPRGYVSPLATIHHRDLRRGRHTFIGDRVTIYQDTDGGPVELEERARLTADIYVQTGMGGRVRIGAGTTIHARCHFSAYTAAISIGERTMIAPNCAFYPAGHGTAPDVHMGLQPLESKGDIVIGDEAWLGVGVIVLSGVRIGDGAVVGAGSVVTKDVPAGAIAVGTPARVVRHR